MAGWAERHKEPRRPGPLFRRAWHRIPSGKRTLFLVFFIGFNLVNAGILFSMVASHETFGSANGHSMEHSQRNLIGVLDDRDQYRCVPYSESSDVVTFFEADRDGTYTAHDHGDIVSFHRDGSDTMILHRVIVYIRLNTTHFDGADPRTVTMDLPEENTFDRSVLFYPHAFDDSSPLSISAAMVAANVMNTTGVNISTVEGYLTRGDNNDQIDQYWMLPVRFPWIEGRVETIDNIFVPPTLPLALGFGLCAGILTAIVLADVLLDSTGRDLPIPYLSRRRRRILMAGGSVTLVMLGSVGPLLVIYWSHLAGTLDTTGAISSLLSLGLGHVFALMFVVMVRPRQVTGLREPGFTDVVLFHPSIVAVLFSMAVLYIVFYISMFHFFMVASSVVFPLLGYSIIPRILGSPHILTPTVGSGEYGRTRFMEGTIRGMLILVLLALFLLNTYIPLWLVPGFFLGWLSIDILLVRDHLLEGIQKRRKRPSGVFFGKELAPG